MPHCVAADSGVQSTGAEFENSGGKERLLHATKLCSEGSETQKGAKKSSAPALRIVSARR